MATLVSKSIGTATRDYADMQLWEDAIPADISAGSGTNEAWVGECYNDSEFSTVVSIAGHTTTATEYITLTTAAGQSFMDHADAATNPLKYDQSKGVGLASASTWVTLFEAKNSDLTVEKIQVKRTGGSVRAVDFDTGNPGTLKNMIIESQGSGAIEAVYCNGSNHRMINCLVVANNTAGDAIKLTYNAELHNVTAVCPSNLTTTLKGVNAGYVTTVVNCCSFGFATDYATTGSWHANSGYNASDSTGNPGSNSQDSKTYTDQFEGTTASAMDFRLKTGSALIGTGTRDQTYTADIDIAGNARDTTAPDIGAWEFRSGTTTVAQSMNHYINLMNG